MTTREQENPALERALAELQATAYNFAWTTIKDATVQAQYTRDIGAMSEELLGAVKNGRISEQEGAQLASQLRNQIMDLSRGRSSAIGRALASDMKAGGRSLADLAETYAGKLFGSPMASLDDTRRAAVYLEIVKSAGRSNPTVNALMAKLGRIGKRVFVASIAVAAYEIHVAEDKPREAGRQTVLLGAGVAGGWAVGTGAVAAGVCATTAPVCVGVAALIGGLLFAFGADLAFGSLYPVPARPTR